jgi:RNA polymerase sigma factor (TIGR02999 family)
MPEKDLTELLQRWSDGDREAEEQLFPLVYEKLRRIAARHLQGERPHHTLQPTDLVNESYLKLQGRHELEWRSRAAFFAVASKVMRNVLVDHARRRRAARRGGGRTPVTIDTSIAAPEIDLAEVLAVDVALDQVAAEDPTRARVIEMRVFGGMTVEEIGEALGCSPRTVDRHWKLGKALLSKHLAERRDGGSEPVEPA